MYWCATSSDIIATFTTFFNAVWCCCSCCNVTSSSSLRHCAIDHFVPKSSLPHVTYSLLCVGFSELLCVPLSESLWSVSSKQCSLCSLRVSKPHILQYQPNFPLASFKCSIKFLLVFFTSKHKSSDVMILPMFFLNTSFLQRQWILQE